LWPSNFCPQAVAVRGSADRLPSKLHPANDTPLTTSVLPSQVHARARLFSRTRSAGLMSAETASHALHSRARNGKQLQKSVSPTRRRPLAAKRRSMSHNGCMTHSDGGSFQNAAAGGRSPELESRLAGGGVWGCIGFVDGNTPSSPSRTGPETAMRPQTRHTD
jgi:hypothetical protein